MTYHRLKPLAPIESFYKKLWKFTLASMITLVFSLGVGVAGYHFIGKLPFIDALLNASMILTGMGPVDHMETDAAKLFSSFYALFSGIAFLTTMAVLFAPLVQRFVHSTHLDMIDTSDEDKSTTNNGNVTK